MLGHRTSKRALLVSGPHARESNAKTNTKHDLTVGAAGALTPQTSDTVKTKELKSEGKNGFPGFITVFLLLLLLLLDDYDWRIL